jgi:hypothetical protein
MFICVGDFSLFFTFYYSFNMIVCHKCVQPVPMITIGCVSWTPLGVEYSIQPYVIRFSYWLSISSLVYPLTKPTTIMQKC